MTFLGRVVMLFLSPKSCGLFPEDRWAYRVFGRLRAFIGLLVLLSLVYPSRASGEGAAAPNPDLEAVLTRSRQRIQTLDYRVTGRITQVEGDGKRTSYKFVAKAHWFPDGLRLLSVFSGPGSETTSILLHMSVNGHLTIDAMLPGEKTVRALPFEHWNDPLLGPDFSYEDMVENQFFLKNQELLPPGKYGARDCFVLKSMPGPQDPTHYDSVTSWIDRGIFYPVHTLKKLRGAGQQKEFIYYSLRQVDGAWSASQVEAKVQGKTGSSRMIIEGGSGRAKLGLKDFEIGQPGHQEKQSR
jgi:hypothetical protein